jgi:BON domain
VLLKGNVGMQETKKAATEIVAAVPGVRHVTNELVAPEAPKPAVAVKPAAKPSPRAAVEEGKGSEE